MPEFIYGGQVPRSYNELRDLDGEIVGSVEHGAVRVLAEAPADGLWFPAGTTIAEPWPTPEAEAEDEDEGQDAEGEGTPAADGDEDNPEHKPVSQPAVPAFPPHPVAASADLAGESA